MGTVVHAVVWYAATGGIGAVKSFADRLANDVTAVAASVAVLFLALNGLRYAASGGHPSRQLEAKSGMVAAAIGLAVTLSASVLVHIVIAALG